MASNYRMVSIRPGKGHLPTKHTDRLIPVSTLLCFQYLSLSRVLHSPYSFWTTPSLLPVWCLHASWYIYPPFSLLLPVLWSFLVKYCAIVSWVTRYFTVLPLEDSIRSDLELFAQWFLMCGRAAWQSCPSHGRFRWACMTATSSMSSCGRPGPAARASTPRTAPVASYTSQLVSYSAKAYCIRSICFWPKQTQPNITITKICTHLTLNRHAKNGRTFCSFYLYECL